MVIGHEEINGVPYINGKKAKKCVKKGCSCRDAMKGAFSEYMCPECGAHLGGETTICLNACHLSAAAASRFSSIMREIQTRPKAKK